MLISTGYAERVIGSILRECLDHVIVGNEFHLRAVLSEHEDHCNGSRTHLALEKDAPDRRSTSRTGKPITLPHLGGMHHRYEGCVNAHESSIRLGQGRRCPTASRNCEGTVTAISRP